MYVVLYSSCTVWTAILSRILLHKQLTFQQWLAVLEVTAGLILSNLNVMLSTSSAGPGATSMVEILTGSLVLLLVSLCSLPFKFMTPSDQTHHRSPLTSNLPNPS